MRLNHSEQVIRCHKKYSKVLTKPISTENCELQNNDDIMTEKLSKGEKERDSYLTITTNQNLFPTKHNICCSF